MEEAIFVSVIIPTYNRKNYLKSALKSLCNQSYPKNKYEIIVVDDGSTDGTRQWVGLQQKNCLCSLRYFFQQNKGPATARNIGIKNALGDVVAFIDSDCIASHAWIEEIVKGYGSDRVAGIGGTIVALPKASEVSQYCAYIKMNEQPLIDKNGIVYLITGNVSFRKDCLNLVKGFDERYNFPGGEDPDLCYRLKKEGYIFKYNRDAVVYNHHKETVGELTKTYFNYGRGDAFLISRRFSSWDFISVSGVRYFIFFLKASGAMMLKSLNYINLIFKFLKIPFKMLLYYGEGLNAKRSFLYAFLDYVKVFSLVQGHLSGYMMAKYKGFKKEDS
jgi:glycosyltransferase involved in cell wall biosynthesis